jgi:hypothetical protein
MVEIGTHLRSISPTFYEHVCAKILAPKIVQTLNMSTKKDCTKLLCKKAVRKNVGEIVT